MVQSDQAPPSGWLAVQAIASLASGIAGALFLQDAQFVRGGALLLFSAAALWWPRSVWTVPPAPPLSPRQRRLALAAVCGVAVFFRLYKMEPPGIWGDDAINGLLALDVLDGKITSPFQLVAHSLSLFHALTNYAIAAAFWALGPGPASLRVPGVLAGILAVPLVYATFSPLFGERVAAVAALFFASSAMQISHSKVLIQVVFGQCFLLLAMAALVRGLIGPHRWLTAVAGAPLALCFYTYHSAKLAPLIATTFVLAIMWRPPAARRRLVLPIVGFVGVFVLCAIPAARSYLQQPDALTGRAGSVSVLSELRGGNLEPLWDAVWRSLMVFHYQQGPVSYHWFGIGWDPAFNPLVGFLLVHGLAQSVRRCTQPRHLLLLCWAVVGLLPGFLSTEAPRGYRVLLASVPLYVWAALPVVQLAGAAGRWLRVGVAALVLAVPLFDFNYYFYRVYTHREFRWYQASRLVEMARTLKSLGPGWTGYVLSNSFGAGYETLAFLSRAWHLTFRDVQSLADVLPVHDEADGGTLFIVDRGNDPALALMRSLYPSVAAGVRTEPPVRSWWLDGWLRLVPDYAARPTVTFFPVPRQTADAIRGLTVTFLAADGRPILTRVDGQLQLDDPDALPAGTAVVKWCGAVYARSDGAYRFMIESGGEAQVWLDGRQIISRTQGEAQQPLAQGLHRISAEAIVSAPPVLRVLWQAPRGDLETLPPALLFRDAEVHGLLAEYTTGSRTLRRVEPYPYYGFFPHTFEGVYVVRWRGQLRVPAPGGYRLQVGANARVGLTIDGRRAGAAQALAAGVHDFEMETSPLYGALRLRLFWEPGDGTPELIPPQAFTPPLDHADFATCGG